jgi:hypothetical protein
VTLTAEEQVGYFRLDGTMGWDEDGKIMGFFVGKSIGKIRQT